MVKETPKPISSGQNGFDVKQKDDVCGIYLNDRVTKVDLSNYVLIDSLEDA